MGGSGKHQGISGKGDFPVPPRVRLVTSREFAGIPRSRDAEKVPGSAMAVERWSPQWRLPPNQTKTQTSPNMKSLLLSLLLAPALALAADDAKPAKPGKGGNRPKHDPEAVFKKLDTNTDGKLTVEEFKASPRAQKDLTKAEGLYKKLDKDSDGNLTLEEFKTPPQRKGGKKGGETKPDAPKTEVPVPETPKKEV